ncbi:MAG: alpha/beta hydrolase [Salinibacterium sp.]|nr:alpha/beta hydrolase [Salinibacterium sp.]MBF0672960.1 alpha/beta hydrolase [Salinibacterium sp.]
MTKHARRSVASHDGLRLTVHEFGEPDAPAVLALHGFASSAIANWRSTGWVRDLSRAGHRILALDQRGHGESDAPHDPAFYSMDRFARDVATVVEEYGLPDVALLGYSLGARVSWLTASKFPHLVRRAVLGGLPSGDPLERFDLAAARDLVRLGRPIDDALTATFMRMASTLPDNDLEALVAVVEGLRSGPQVNIAQAPRQALLLATGTEDPLLEQSRSLSEAAPDASFLELPGRHHFNAPTSRDFRHPAIEFLSPNRQDVGPMQ